MDSLAFFILKKSCFEKRDRNSGSVRGSDPDVSVKVSIRSATTACDSLYCSALVDASVSSSSASRILFLGSLVHKPLLNPLFYFLFFYFFLFFVFCFLFFVFFCFFCFFWLKKRVYIWSGQMRA